MFLLGFRRKWTALALFTSASVLVIDALVNLHWARVRFGPVPLACCGNGLIVNSPAAVSFTVLSQTPRRPRYFQSSTIALDTGLLLKAKMPIRDLTTELESRSNMDPSDILD